MSKRHDVYFSKSNLKYLEMLKTVLAERKKNDPTVTMAKLIIESVKVALPEMQRSNGTDAKVINSVESEKSRVETIRTGKIFRVRANLGPGEKLIVGGSFYGKDSENKTVRHFPRVVISKGSNSKPKIEATI